jgi:hypothetical protein
MRKTFMIIRYIVVDPDDNDELIVFQVPERSRSEELLKWMLEETHCEYATIQSNRRKKKED